MKLDTGTLSSEQIQSKGLQEINVFKSRFGVYIGFCPHLWIDVINSHIVPGSVLALWAEEL